MTDTPIASIRSIVEHLNSCEAAPEGAQLAASTLASMGIHSAYPNLQGSPFESGVCMKETTFSLSFLGHTASKWRDHPAFEGFLERLSRSHGHARFLLSEDVSVGVLEQLADFQQRFRAFEARVYMSRPLFRLVIQDEEAIALQHYEGLDSVPIGKRGDAPLIGLSARGEESLFRTMVIYFATTWQSATRIEEL